VKKKWIDTRAKRGLTLGALIIICLALTGCSGSSRPTTWTVLAVGDGVVYAADLEQVHALSTDASDSPDIVWSFPEEPDLRSYGPFYTVTLAPDAGVLLVTSYERTGSGIFARSYGVLRALSADDGTELWPQPVTANGEFVAPGAVADGTLVIGNSDGNVYAFDVEAGSPAWSQPFPTDGRVWSSPLVISDTVYVTSLDHRLYALDLATGRERWERPFEAGGAIIGQPLRLGNHLYVGGFDSTLYAVPLGGGSAVWQFQGQDWFWGTLATDGSTIYAADVGGTVYALDAETGDPQWTRPASLGEPIRLGPGLSADGQTLVLAGHAGTLYALDTEDGSQRWAVPQVGQLASMEISEGVIYVTRIFGDYRVQAFQIDSGEEVWSFPPLESEE